VTNPDAEPRRPVGPRAVGVSLCVLASGSSGNCAVLVARPDPDAPRRVVLIDAGLSPRRTGRLLLERGIRPDEVDDIVFTHLDSDHCHPGWPGAIRPGGWRARLRIHRRHLGRAERSGLLCAHTVPFDDTLTIDDALGAEVGLESHDDLGVAAFRFVARDGGDREAHLGYATDVGRVTDGLIDLLAGVDTLAIESNYCPIMQNASDRPEFLKRRIMGGSGHLSNEESADAARDIAPTQHLVLLHLSRQCNTPERAVAAHTDADPRGPAAPPACAVSSQFRPTEWIDTEPGPAGRARPRVSPPVAVRARSLFDLPARGGAAW
jgi:phosphoribosyl 1,2-cyclic phosphodiesterase